MPLGQGHQDYGRYAQNRGSNPARLLVPAADDETGTLVWAATRVQIIPTGRCMSVARLENRDGVEHMRGGGH